MKNESKYDKKYYQKNKEIIAKKNCVYRQNNKVKIAKQKCKYRQSKANYDTYASQISYADKVKNVNGFLQTKCAYCGKWYFPTILSIINRKQSLNGNQSGENRLYCSNECKEACPIFKKSKFQEGHPLKNQNSSREVQPELRQMVFERDNYTCLKCKKHQDELDIPLHCHHIEGILWNPLESADIDQCMTVCKDCHNEIHQQEDCGYHDMRCSK